MQIEVQRSLHEQLEVNNIEKAHAPRKYKS